MILNMLEKQNTNLDSVFDNLQSDLSDHVVISQRQAITIWLPDEYKIKYDLLQERTKRRFGKLVKELLKKSIDKIDLNSI